MICFERNGTIRKTIGDLSTHRNYSVGEIGEPSFLLLSLISLANVHGDLL